MKTYLLSLLIAGQCVVALAQEKTPHETKSLSGATVKDVYVETSGGSITVSGAAGESPRVEVYVQGNNNQQLSKEEIEKRLAEDYMLQVTVANNEIHALAKRKHENHGWDWKKSLSISFKIFLPKNVNTQLTTSGGSINLNELSGNENFTTSGGSLNINGLIGKIKGETSGGSVRIANSSEEIDLQTSGGTMRADNCTGNINMETSGGSIMLANLKGNIKANTSGGAIRAEKIEGDFDTSTSGGSVSLSQLSCSLKASTSGGNMSVDLNGVGHFVKLETNGGNLDLKLPLKAGMDLNFTADHINNPDNTNGFTGDWTKTHVKGSVNGGGIPVNADVEGRLNISFN